MSPALIFLHRTPFQNYLKIALEQARVMNPTSPIYLISDVPCPLPPSWQITQVLFSELPSERLSTFNHAYTHVSTNSPEFEKFCFQRWFYIDALLERENITHALHIDSDCILTARAADVFARFGPALGLHFCRSGSPHCTLIHGRLTPLLDFFISTFHSSQIPAHQARMAQSQSAGNIWVLSDMFVMRDYMQAGGAGSLYWYDTHPDVVITAIMNLSEGYELWPGKRDLKRVHWRVENNLLIPYLRELSSGRLIRAYALHYKGAAKRRMRHFNPPQPILPAALRAWWHNHFAPVNGPRWVA